jgi:FlaG/FlaF family flagellin (archaellin)
MAQVAQKEDQKGSSTRHGDAAEVASVLMGTYRLQGGDAGDANVQLQIASSGGTDDSGNLLATLSGRFQGHDLNQQGIIHLDNQGSRVLMSLTPKLIQGPEAAAKPSGQVSSTEMQAACTLSLQPAGQGWTGTTKDPGNCVKALAMNRDVGQWQFQLTSQEIRITDATSKQTLVFEKTSGSGKAGQ